VAFGEKPVRILDVLQDLAVEYGILRDSSHTGKVSPS